MKLLYTGSPARGATWRFSANFPEHPRTIGTPHLALQIKGFRVLSFRNCSCPSEGSCLEYAYRAGAPGPQACARDAADVTNREAAADGDGAVAAPHKNPRQVVWSSFDAFCFGPRPFDQPVCVRQRGHGASLALTPHRSSQRGRPSPRGGTSFPAIRPSFRSRIEILTRPPAEAPDLC